MPHCLVLGAGRIAGGFVAPLLHDAGWEATLVSRTPQVVDAVNTTGGVDLWLSGADGVQRRRIDGLDALVQDDEAGLAAAVTSCDLLVTSVGASQLRRVAAGLASLLAHRVRSGRPLNVIAFENHPNAAHELARVLIAHRPEIAPHVGRTLGIAGAAVWRCVARREVGDDAVAFFGDDDGECHVDRSGLVDGAPLDGSLPGLALSPSFRARITEKLWLANAPHAAAAYLGWQRGHETIDAALADPVVADAAATVVAEAQEAFVRWQASRPWADPIPARAPETLLARHADERLADPVVRVGRDPRRKLAAVDRLVAPALVLSGSGEMPDALADVCAAALDYRHAGDAQALDIGAEIRLLGAAETFAAIAGLDAGDRFVQTVARRFGLMREQSRAGGLVGAAA
jgi:mannitol-1-phosphate 5-dehydrogenase